MIRLDKYLADMGTGTRLEVKKYIKKGRVAVDGVPVKNPETKVDEKRQTVCLDGAPVSYAAYEYYMLNKPAGVVSASRDDRERTVVDLIESRRRKDLFPVGRLDRDTEGLLIITNDGALAHRLLSPRKHVDKCYYAQVAGRVGEEDVLRFKEGIDIGKPDDPLPVLPAKLEIIKNGELSEVRLTIQEGKFHQVKRMFLALGKEVVYLKRERIGALVLDETLRPGMYRQLTEEELGRL